MNLALCLDATRANTHLNISVRPSVRVTYSPRVNLLFSQTSVSSTWSPCSLNSRLRRPLWRSDIVASVHDVSGSITWSGQKVLFGIIPFRNLSVIRSLEVNLSPVLLDSRPIALSE